MGGLVINAEVRGFIYSVASPLTKNDLWIKHLKGYLLKVKCDTGLMKFGHVRIS